MADLTFHVEITAVGEVRDKDGNLISSAPVHGETIMTEQELIEAGIPVPDKEK